MCSVLFVLKWCACVFQDEHAIETYNDGIDHACCTQFQKYDDYDDGQWLMFDDDDDNDEADDDDDDDRNLHCDTGHAHLLCSLTMLLLMMTVMRMAVVTTALMMKAVLKMLAMVIVVPRCVMTMYLLMEVVIT